ncbi:hypothetical protein D2W49_35735, partial [Burkholderia pseudomallei]
MCAGASYHRVFATRSRFAAPFAMTTEIAHATAHLRRAGRRPLRAVALAAIAAAALAGCKKPEEASAPPDNAASAAAHAARQTTQKLDQVASFVNQQIEAAKQGVASAASAVPPVTASSVSAAAQ